MDTAWNGRSFNRHVYEPASTQVLGTNGHNGVSHRGRPGLVVVIGGSAGARDALGLLTSSLDPEFSAPMLVALHYPPRATSVQRKLCGRFPFSVALEGEPLQPGRITFAPWDRHLVVGDGRLHLTGTRKEHMFRPAIDPLFRTAARRYGPRAIGVLLSGLNADGTAGLLNIVLRGGIAIVQDPAEAAYPAMPMSALENVPGVRCLPVVEIAKLLRHASDTAISGQALDFALAPTNV
jgi:two-component system chemotaxis response regulator CheB